MTVLPRRRDERLSLTRRRRAHARGPCPKSCARRCAQERFETGSHRMNRFLAALAVTILLAVTIGGLLLRIRPPVERFETADRAQLDAAIRRLERLPFQYGLGIHGETWGLRRRFDEVFVERDEYFRYHKRPSIDELLTASRDAARRIDAQFDRALLGTGVGVVSGWLGLGLAWLIVQVSRWLSRNGPNFGRAARSHAVLVMGVLACAPVAVLGGVLVPVMVVEGDVPTVLLSSPAMLGALVFWRTRRRSSRTGG
jgi:hypothetical protein